TQRADDRRGGSAVSPLGKNQEVVGGLRDSLDGANASNEQKSAFSSRLCHGPRWVSSDASRGDAWRRNAQTATHESGASNTRRRYEAQKRSSRRAYPEKRAAPQRQLVPRAFDRVVLRSVLRRARCPVVNDARLSAVAPALRRYERANETRGGSSMTQIIHDRLERFLSDDVHLRKGTGQGANGTIDVCAVQAADWLSGGSGKTDSPSCVSAKIAAYVIRLHDSLLFSDHRDLLKPYCAKLVGTAGQSGEREV